MPSLTNRQHEAFCQAYVRGPHAGSLVDAYAAAGFSRDSGNAKRLSRQPDVARRIDELQREQTLAEAVSVRAMFAELAITRARLVQELATIAFANPFDFVDEDGGPDIDALRAKGGALREVSIDTVMRKDGSSIRKVRIKLIDKRQALAELARTFQATTEVPAVDVSEMRSEEWHRNNAAATLRELAEDGFDMAGFFASIIPPRLVEQMLRKLLAEQNGGVSGEAPPNPAASELAASPPLAPEAEQSAEQPASDPMSVVAPSPPALDAAPVTPPSAESALPSAEEPPPPDPEASTS